MNAEIAQFDDMIIHENEVFGQGYISIVKRAHHKLTNREYAVKIVP